MRSLVVLRGLTLAFAAAVVAATVLLYPDVAEVAVPVEIAVLAVALFVHAPPFDPARRELAARTAACATLLVHGAFLPRRRQREGGALGTLLTWMGPDLAVFAALSVLFVLAARIGGVSLGAPRDPLKNWLPIAALAVAAFVGALRNLPDLARDKPGALKSLTARALSSTRDWLAIGLLLGVFARLGGLATELGTSTFVRHGWDLRLLHAEPSAWAAHFFHPRLTDALAIVYVAFLLQPMAIAVLLLARGRRDLFRTFASAIVLVTYTAFIVFCLVPASASRLDASHPSLPCALVTVSALEAWSRRHLVRPAWALPTAMGALALALYIAAASVRYRWLADVLTGIALGAGGYWVNRALVRRWPGRRTRTTAGYRSRLAA